jgi:hypothetical protein
MRTRQAELKRKLLHFVCEQCLFAHLRIEHIGAGVAAQRKIFEPGANRGCTLDGGACSATGAAHAHLGDVDNSRHLMMNCCLVKRFLNARPFVRVERQIVRNKRTPNPINAEKERDMSERGMAHLVGLSITGVYFLCIALAAAAMM